MVCELFLVPVPEKHFLPPVSSDIADWGRKNMSTYFMTQSGTFFSGRYTNILVDRCVGLRFANPTCGMLKKTETNEFLIEENRITVDTVAGMGIK